MSIIGTIDHLLNREPWMDMGLCREVGQIFHPEKNERAKVAEAKRICQTCDVQAQCLEYALKTHERWGIWGGYTERERRRLRRSA